MGKSLNIVWSVLTALLTLGTTALMGVVIMTSHWEVITYSQSIVESLLSVEENPENKTFVRPLLDGRVIVVSREDEENELLVKMHAGLWATCYDLTGNNGYEIINLNVSWVLVYRITNRLTFIQNDKSIPPAIYPSKLWVF